MPKSKDRVVVDLVEYGAKRRQDYWTGRRLVAKYSDGKSQFFRIMGMAFNIHDLDNMAITHVSFKMWSRGGPSRLLVNEPRLAVRIFHSDGDLCINYPYNDKPKYADVWTTRRISG
ncbi:MAG: hypothetical protein ACXABY_04215 [Candidatus Thorarchaeota archaeon]